MIKTIFQDLPTITALLNIILGLSAASFQFLCVLNWKDKIYLWLEILYGIVCIYWVGVYVAVIVSIVTGSGFAQTVFFSTTFIYPGVAYTLALVAFSGLYRYRVIKARKKQIKELNGKLNHHQEQINVP